MFAANDTKMDYITKALEALLKRFGGDIVLAEEKPHYSRLTKDWFISDLEVAGCSERTDWDEGIIFEISIGIDRLLNLLLENKI